jgi:signal transduction histidine kinase
LLALVAASVAGLIYSASPVLSGRAGMESGGGIRLISELIGAFAFAAAAVATPRTIAKARRVPVLLAALAAAGTIALAGLLGPIPPAADLMPAGVLIVAAAAFLLRAARGETERRLLAGATFLLSGATLHNLAMPAVATDWVTPREGLRLAAYALLLGAAYHRYASLHRRQAYSAISSERERIARDLHDGLAQDLACIVTQAQRLDVGLGPHHPLIIATRRALAASRGTIADLAASTAPTTEAALNLVADELAHRFGVMVEVRIETDVALTAGNDLEPSRREDLIRVAREAIVNAALHGEAGHVELVLQYKRGDLLMRVSDDGGGLADTHKPGFGLRTMRARAASLGGQINARPRAEGGTELELVVP